MTSDPHHLTLDCRASPGLWGTHMVPSLAYAVCSHTRECVNMPHLYMLTHPCLNTDNRHSRARAWGYCGLPTWDSVVLYSSAPLPGGAKGEGLTCLVTGDRLLWENSLWAQ